MKIDTGIACSTESPIRRACYESELDALPENATDAQVVDYVSQIIMGRIGAYKSLKHMRAHLLSRWGLLALIAELEPEIFDSIMMEYAERVTEIT